MEHFSKISDTFYSFTDIFSQIIQKSFDGQHYQNSLTLIVLFFGIFRYIKDLLEWRKRGRPKSLRSNYFLNMMCAAGLLDNGIGLFYSKYYYNLERSWIYHSYSAMLLTTAYILKYTRVMKTKLGYILIIFISQYLQIKAWYLVF